MRAGVGGWATLAVKAVCVAAVVMSAYSAVHLLGGVPGTGISAVRTMTPANRARPGAPRGAAAAAAGGDTEPTQNGPESKNDRPPSVGADHQADSQADTYSSDEMMHVVVLAVGMDASRIAAFSLARGIMVASDPKEQAITFHILSDRCERARDALPHRTIPMAMSFFPFFFSSTDDGRTATLAMSARARSTALSLTAASHHGHAGFSNSPATVPQPSDAPCPCTAPTTITESNAARPFLLADVVARGRL